MIDLIHKFFYKVQSLSGQGIRLWVFPEADDVDGFAGGSYIASAWKD